MTPGEALQALEVAALPGLVDRLDTIVALGRDYASALDREAAVPRLRQARQRLARLRRAAADLRSAVREIDPVTGMLLAGDDAGLLPAAYRAATEVGTAAASAQGQVEAEIAPRLCRGGAARVLPRRALRDLVAGCADLLLHGGQVPTSTDGGALHRLVAALHGAVTGDCTERGVKSTVRELFRKSNLTTVVNEVRSSSSSPSCSRDRLIAGAISR